MWHVGGVPCLEMKGPCGRTHCSSQGKNNNTASQVMAKSSNGDNGIGSTFCFASVRTASDIPKPIWEQALPEIKKEIPTVLNVGEIPSVGGSVSVNCGPPPKDKWHSGFCAILERFDGTPIVAAT